MEEIVIKPLEEITDIEGLRSLYNSSINIGDFILFDNKFTYEEELVWYQRMIDDILAGKSIIYVALIDQKIVGICSATRESGRKSHNVFLGIIIHKDYRGKGIGKYLLKYVISKAKEQLNPKNIWLEVVDVNYNAIALYSSSGFKKVAELKDWYFKDGKYFNEYIMLLTEEC